MAQALPGIDFEDQSFMEAPNFTGSPERRLLLAIVERAILDFVGNDQKEVEESEYWIFSGDGDENKERFSFGWVCQELDLDIKDIRDKIKNMPKRGESRIAPWYTTRSYANSDKSTLSKAS